MADTTNDNPADFDVNINDLYSKLISPIDNMRSFVNINDGNNKGVIQIALDNLDSSHLLAAINIQQKLTEFQESRFSAMLRFIGFPIVADSDITSANINFFNPGYNCDNPNDSVNEKFNLLVTSNQSVDANKFFEEREQFYLVDVKNPFTNSKTSPIDMNLFLREMSLSSSFLDIDKKLDGLFAPDSSSFSRANYYYKLNLIPEVEKYYDTFGNNRSYTDNTKTLINTTSLHYFYPLVNDGRICITIQPSNRTTTTPFCNSNKYNNDVLKRPLLEKIIKDRFAVGSDIAGMQYIQQQVASQKEKSQYYIQQDVILRQEGLSKDDNITNLYNNLNGAGNPNVYNDDDVIKIQRFIYAIEKLVEQLVENQKLVKTAMENYLWMPKCNEAGPEFGISSTDPYIPLSSDITVQPDLSILSELDLEILKNTQKDNITRILSSFSTTDKNKNDEYAFNQFYAVFAPDQVSGFISKTKKDLDKAIADRKQALSSAELALKNIEIITGQVSGLGLIDIIIVISALHLIKKENLLGFLDQTSFDKASKLQNIPATQPTLKEAYDDLDTQILTLYAVARQAYEKYDSN
jgi:hypothetical protein